MRNEPTKVGFGPDAAPRPDNIEFFDYFTRPGGISQRKVHYLCFHKVFRFAAKLQKNGEDCSSPAESYRDDHSGR